MNPVLVEGAFGRKRAEGLSKKNIGDTDCIIYFSVDDLAQILMAWRICVCVRVCVCESVRVCLY